MLNILVACKEQKAPGGLEHLGPHRIVYSTLPDWAAAANALLSQAQALGGDALFCDDDVTFLPQSLVGVRRYSDCADLFGLDLHDMTGARQAGARHTLDEHGALADWVHPGPAYVAHVSTSAIYLKANVLQSGVRFPEWTGIHWEDVAFCLDAWLFGLRVMAVPGRVDHAIVGGVGATKRHDARFWERWALNRQCFAKWCAERGVVGDARIPIGAREL